MNALLMVYLLDSTGLTAQDETAVTESYSQHERHSLSYQLPQISNGSVAVFYLTELLPFFHLLPLQL